MVVWETLIRNLIGREDVNTYFEEQDKAVLKVVVCLRELWESQIRNSLLIQISLIGKSPAVTN